MDLYFVTEQTQWLTPARLCPSCSKICLRLWSLQVLKFQWVNCDQMPLTICLAPSLWPASFKSPKWSSFLTTLFWEEIEPKKPVVQKLTPFSRPMYLHSAALESNLTWIGTRCCAFRAKNYASSKTWTKTSVIFLWRLLWIWNRSSQQSWHQKHWFWGATAWEICRLTILIWPWFCKRGSSQGPLSW